MNNDKLVEARMREYFSDLDIIESCEEKLKCIDGREDVADLLNEEIKATKERIFRIKFKNKHIELFLQKLSEEEKKYVELRYQKKLNANEIMDYLYMVEGTYYRMRKNLMKRLKELVL